MVKNNENDNEKTKAKTKDRDPLPKIYADGLWNSNPVLIMLLGLCPALAVTSSGLNGLAMGVATIFVLVMANLAVSILRGIIPAKMRIPSFIVIIATFVTVIDLLMEAYANDLHGQLGIFIPLIVVNCIILGRAEAFAYKKSVWKSFNDGLAMGVGFTLALVAMGVIREIFGNNSVFGYNIFGEDFNNVLFMILPPGAFLTLGYLLALSHYINNKRAERKKA
ncbi:MAG: electron transport complex subunit E [Leptospirales bacterium]